MKNNKTLTLDQRPWAPDCFITASGLVLSKSHVMKVMTLADAKAALMTTAIIERLLKS